MSASYKDTILEAFAVAPAAEVILDTLEINHASFAEPIRLVANTEDFQAAVTAGGPLVTWTACAFDLTLPPQDDGSRLPEMTLGVDNVSNLLRAPLKAALASQTPVTATYRPYLFSDPSGPQLNPPLTLSLSEITVDVLRVEAKARLPDITRRNFPARNYKSSQFPALAG